MKKIDIIVNPISGTKKNKTAIINFIQSALEGLADKIDIKLTAHSGHAAEMAKEAAANKTDMVIAVGGDGTVNEIASALSGSQTVMAIVPCGSGNGLARHLKIPMDYKKAVDLIRKGNPTIIDSGEINGKKFFCTCGTGFDAQVAFTFASLPKRGLMNYVKSALSEYKAYRCNEYSVKADGCDIKGRFFLISVGNASQYGNNAYITPRAKTDDGLLDVVLVHECGLIPKLRLGYKMFTRRLDTDRCVSYLQVPEVTIENLSETDYAIHYDGEPVQMHGAMTIKCIPQQLTIISGGDKNC